MKKEFNLSEKIKAQRDLMAYHKGMVKFCNGAIKAYKKRIKMKKKWLSIEEYYKKWIQK